MSKVAFVKVKDVNKEGVHDAVKKALELAEWKKFIEGKKFFIKINGISDQVVPGQCTSPWVIESVVYELKKSFPDCELFMGDADLAAAKQLDKASKAWGYLDIADKYDVKFVNLSNEPLIRVDCGGKVFKQLDLPKILLDVDTIINIPVPKTHCLTTITGCMKNHWGMVPRFRHQFHPVADQAIPDINHYFSKTRFNLMDLTISMEENAPRTGISKICGIIMASPDRVAADYTIARFMGFEPNKIEHIINAEILGLGSTKDIEIVGDEFEVDPFKPPEPDKQPIFFWEMRLRKIPIVKPMLFDTPVFNLLAAIATKYNTFLWYNKFGKKYIEQISQTPWASEFEPLWEGYE
ncbi:MAG: DUF362 domain-containing protein [Methanotrichaceae archaeon]|nr:DUF362 domain-containing protein [Methanotrichaceae archaeon]